MVHAVEFSTLNSQIGTKYGWTCHRVSPNGSHMIQNFTTFQSQQLQNEEPCWSLLQARSLHLSAGSEAAERFEYDISVDLCSLMPGHSCSSLGHEVLKILSVGHRLNLISRIQEITLARNFCSFSSEALQSL